MLAYIIDSDAALRRGNVAKLAKEKNIVISRFVSPAYTDENWDILAKVIRTTASLEKLMFQGRGTAIALQNKKVIDALASNRTINELSLWAAHGCDEGAKAVAAILKENSTIDFVRLGHNDIGVEGAKAIVEALKQNTNIKTLSLWFNQIGDEGEKAIADALKQNDSLHELRIGGNNIGDQGAKVIAEALKENTNLQTLHLTCNNIGEEGGKQILKALKQIERSAIENIDLKRNEISEETLAKIKQEMIRIQNRLESVGSNEDKVASVETTEDGEIQGDKNASSSNEDEVLTTVNATNASQVDISAESDKESNETRGEIKAMEAKIREQQSIIAQQQAELAQKDGNIAKKDKEVATVMMERSRTTRKMTELHSAIAQLHDELALKQEEIASLRIQRLNGVDVGSDDLENYTKCCVCLEPYEEDLNSGGSQRLPIKSATCAHSLCEGCLDDYHASLMNGRSTLRYVRCPQCNDKTKKAFDIQNKVVDFFLREYIQCRKRKRSA